MRNFKFARIDLSTILIFALAAFVIAISGCETESVLDPEVLETEQAFGKSLSKTENAGESSPAADLNTFASVKTQASPGMMDESVQVRAGEVFTVSLESNPTTGYSWQPGFDPELLELVSSEFTPESTLMGAPGTEKFEFRALKEGQVEITMEYKRPWEDNVLEERTIQVKIAPAIVQ